MIINSYGHDIRLTSAMKLAITGKLLFLEKFLASDMIVTVSVKKIDDNLSISVSFAYKGQMVRIEQKDPDFYVGLDKLSDTLKNKMSKLHKIKTEHSNDSLRNIQIEEENVDDFNEESIVYDKIDNIKTLTPKEAINELDNSSKIFYFFYNKDMNNKFCFIEYQKNEKYKITEIDQK